MFEKCRLWNVLIVVLLFFLVGHGAPHNWLKYISQDGSFSFHYPKGWQVSEGESGIVIEDDQNQKQFLLVPLPYQAHWIPAEHAQFSLT